MTDEKTQVQDVNRAFYDFRYEDRDSYRIDGLTVEIVRQISREKKDPDWMRDFRLKSLEIFHRTEMPDWGPSIEGLDMDHFLSVNLP